MAITTGFVSLEVLHKRTIVMRVQIEGFWSNSMVVLSTKMTSPLKIVWHFYGLVVRYIERPSKSSIKQRHSNVNHPQTLIFLARTIRPQWLETIRYLQITWYDLARFWHVVLEGYDRAPDDLATWETMWKVIGKQMISLTSLKLSMVVDISHDASH
jgi:hypothetical protein